MDKYGIGIGELNIGIGELQTPDPVQAGDSDYKRWVDVISIGYGTSASNRS